MLKRVMLLCVVIMFAVLSYGQSFEIKRCDFNTPLDEGNPFFMNDDLYFSSNNRFKIDKEYSNKRPPRVKRDKFKVYAVDHLLDSNVSIVYSGKGDLDVSSFVFCEETQVGYFTIKINKISRFRWARKAIYTSSFLDGKWSKMIPFKYNSNSFNLENPSISSDGTRLFFNSDMDGGYGEMDIWYCEKLEDNSWGKPINVGSFVNTKKNEVTPFIDASNQLYFSTDKNKTKTGFDIYVYNYNTKKIKKMPSPINSTKDDLGFVKTDKDFHGFFSSSRDGMRKDIYEFYRPIPTNPIVVESNISKKCFTFYDPKPFDDSLRYGYVWDFGDGVTGSEVNVRHCYETGGIYEVSLFITDELDPLINEKVKTKPLIVDSNSLFYFRPDTLVNQAVYNIAHPNMSIDEVIWLFNSKYYFDQTSFFMDSTINYGQHVLKAHLRKDSTQYLLVDTLMYHPDLTDANVLKKVNVLLNEDNSALDQKGELLIKEIYSKLSRQGSAVLYLPLGYELSDSDSLSKQLAAYLLSYSVEYKNDLKLPYIEVVYD